MNNTDDDLNTLPEGVKIPSRCIYRSRNPILISKADFDYMEERSFHGRFTIVNRAISSKKRTSMRLAAVLKKEDRNIVLSIAQERRTANSPDGATWRTVRLLSAFKPDDSKYCVIEIEPPMWAKRGEVSA